MTHRSHFAAINFENEKQGQDQSLCASVKTLSLWRPDWAGGDLSTMREDASRHALMEESSL
jgi:hypothetical protein